MPSVPTYPPLLGDLLAQTAARLPDKEALVFGEQRITWREFDEHVTRLAAAFLEMNIGRGDRIGIISTTRPEYLFTYLAAARIGAILTGFNILYTPHELTRLATLTRPKLMLVLDRAGDKKVAAALKPLFDGLGFVENYVVIGGAAPEGALTMAALFESDYPDREERLAARQNELTENDGVLIVFTSGSTGLPKGAVLTHKNIIDNIAVETREFGFREDDRLLLHLPMNHVGGATELTVPALLTGATLVLMDHFHPAHTLDTVARERITVLGQVPTMFILEFGLPNFAGYDLSSLRLAAVAGAATPPPVMQKIMQIAPCVMTGYGMTEVAGFVTYTKPEDDAETVATTVGAVAPEFELIIVDESRRPVPTGEVGEVALRGSCVMQGYFDDPEETAAAIDADGWFYTGDLGRLDERGYLTLVDRKKEMYITGGYNVYPREVEEYISLHPKVALVACIGTADEKLGEVGVAYLVPKPGTELTSDEIRAHCVKGLAEYKIPKSFHLRGSLPLTPLGKVDKMQLRRELEDG